ncbi:WD40 repeat domain-containing protein [Desulfonema magnum]|nr:WD40 repeat domain-containing protein [Desulfonema magnum]
MNFRTKSEKYFYIMLVFCVLFSAKVIFAEKFSAKEWNTLKMNGITLDVKFSPKGNYFAYRVYNAYYVCDQNYNVIWQYENNEAPLVITSRLFDFSPDEKYIAFGRYQTSHDIGIFRLSDRKIIQILKGHSDHLNSVLFGPDETCLISGSSDKTVKIWNLSGGKFFERQTLRGHSKPVYSLSFSPDGVYLASGGLDKNIKIWKSFRGRFSEFQTLKGHPYIENVCFSPDGKYLASGGFDEDIIKIWKLSRGGFFEFQTLKGHSETVENMAFSPDGKYLALGSRNRFVKIWKLSQGIFIEFQILKGHSDKIGNICFSPDGKYLASGGWDHTVRIWKLNGVSSGMNIPMNKVKDAVASLFRHPIWGNIREFKQDFISLLRDPMWEGIGGMAGILSFIVILMRWGKRK